MSTQNFTEQAIHVHFQTVSAQKAAVSAGQVGLGAGTKPVAFSILQTQSKAGTFEAVAAARLSFRRCSMLSRVV